MRSIEHSLDFVVKGLVVQVVNLNGLEVFLGIEVTLGDEECLPEHQFLDFSVIVVHDIVIDVAFLLVDLQKIGDLLCRQLLSFVGSWLVVHHLVQLR